MSTDITSRSRIGKVRAILFLGAVIWSFAWPQFGAAQMVFPGLAGHHPLSSTEVGRLLRHELQCAACHQGQTNLRLSERRAPDLSDVGARVAPGFLKSFLASPQSVHVGTTMPDMLTSYTPEKRIEIAEALTHFLIANSPNPFRERPVNDVESEVKTGTEFEVGRDLFHSVGCVACHAPREAIAAAREQTPYPESDEDTDQEGDDQEAESEESDEDGTSNQAKRRRDVQSRPSRGVSLDHVAAKYSQMSLSDFLHQPLKVRSSGRMPDMKLTPSESFAIAGYLRHASDEDREALIPDASLVATGRRYFQELRCGSCHALEGIPTPPLLAELVHVDNERGCLSQMPGAGPRFHLDPEHWKAIALSLSSVPAETSPTLDVGLTLTAFNCIACHVRDDFGGVAEDRNDYFQTSERNLGDDGRIPPPLTSAGGKLRPEWLRKVLFDGESVRPYMATRMPQFHESNLRGLPETLEGLDKLAPVALRDLNPESNDEQERILEKTLRPAGQALLGDQGLNCVACHNFNGKPSPLNKGIDLMTTHERLQPAWFDGFVRAPGRLRPGIIMPYAWADGVAAHRTILDGDTDLQIQAIWYYLSLGTSAADPPGIRRPEMRLEVGDSVRTYRGRSSIAGYRGIAVGYPEGMSYAFNAETGTLSAIWLGPYIRVDRGGQGSGGFQAASEPIRLVQDVSFLQTSQPSSPWPSLPVMNEKQRENPNPLYPKNLGYQFRGYQLDSASNPTFKYQFGGVAIEDSSRVVSRDGRLALARTLAFTSKEHQQLWFRGLTGAIEQESENVFRVGKLRWTIPNALRKLLRTSVLETDTEQSVELLLHLDIPVGTTTMEFNYEPL